MDEKLITVSIDSMVDKHIGKRGTERREAFEQKLDADLQAQSSQQVAKRDPAKRDALEQESEALKLDETIRKKENKEN